MAASRRSKPAPQVDLAQAATMFAVPARARILLGLEAKESCSAGELAEAAGVSPSTASSHLLCLTENGLLTVEQRGRQRRYRLAGPQVRAALEALRLLAALPSR